MNRRKTKSILVVLLLFCIATPVIVSMAIPEGAEDFYVVAVMQSAVLRDIRGVQKYDQSGVLYDDIEEDPIGTIDMGVLITNANNFYDGGTARARVHFTMMFFDDRVITGIIVGKTSLDITTDPPTQSVDGIFVGRGSHVKGTVSLQSADPNVLVFDGKEW